MIKLTLPKLFPLIVLVLSAFPALGQTSEKVSPDLTAYMDRMKVMIKRHWYPPKTTKKSRIVASFGLDNSGQVHEIRVLTSSGDAVKDAAAMEAIKATVPLEALPKEGPQYVNIEFTFDFDPKFGPNSKATYKPAPEEKHH